MQKEVNDKLLKNCPQTHQSKANYVNTPINPVNSLTTKIKRNGQSTAPIKPKVRRKDQIKKINSLAGYQRNLQPINWKINRSKPKTFIQQRFTPIMGINGAVELKALGAFMSGYCKA